MFNNRFWHSSWSIADAQEGLNDSSWLLSSISWMKSADGTRSCNCIKLLIVDRWYRPTDRGMIAHFIILLLSWRFITRREALELIWENCRCWFASLSPRFIIVVNRRDRVMVSWVSNEPVNHSCAFRRSTRTTKHLERALQIERNRNH